MSAAIRVPLTTAHPFFPSVMGDGRPLMQVTCIRMVRASQCTTYSVCFRPTTFQLWRIERHDHGRDHQRWANEYCFGRVFLPTLKSSKSYSSTIAKIRKISHNHGYIDKFRFYWKTINTCLPGCGLTRAIVSRPLFWNHDVGSAY